MSSESTGIDRIISTFRKVTVEPVLFLFMFAGFLTAPTVQALMYKKICLHHFNDTVCEHLDRAENEAAEDTVQTVASHWFLAENLCYEIPSILMSFVYGNLSDLVSRKAAIILPLIGQMLSTSVYIANAAAFNIPVGWIVVGPFISGWFGGWIGCCLATFSYISDDSCKEERTLRIGIAEGAIGLGLALSSFIGGTLLDHTSFVFVLSSALVLYASALLYTCIVVKDPNEPGHELNSQAIGGSEISHKVKVVLSAKNMKKAMMVIVVNRPLNRRKHIGILLLIILLAGLSLSPSWTLGYLYVKRHPLSWTQSMYGYYIGTRLSLDCLSNLVVLPLMKVRWKMAETKILFLGIMTLALAEILFGCSVVTWMVFLVPFVGNVIGSNRAACMRSLLSSYVEPHEYGKVFAVLGSFQSIVGILSSAFYNNIYPLTLNHWAGLCFAIGASLSAIPLVLLVWLHKDMTKMNIYRTLKEDTDDIGVAIVGSSGIENTEVDDMKDVKVAETPTV